MQKRSLCSIALTALSLLVGLTASASADTLTYQLTMPNIGTNVSISNYSFTSSAFSFEVPLSDPAAQNLYQMFQKIVVQGNCVPGVCPVPTSEVLIFDNSQLAFTDTFTNSFLTKLSLGSIQTGGDQMETASFDYASMTETAAAPTGAVPEPSTLALMTSAFSLVGFRYRRRLLKRS